MQSKNEMVCQKWMRSNSASPRLSNLRVNRRTPTEHVGWRSTETVLNCSASGGSKGGFAYFSLEGADGLVQYEGRTFPYSHSLAPEEKISFKNRYRATKASESENDIKVTATFVENETGWTQEKTDEATAVRLTFMPSVHAPENDSDCRHRYGVREKVECLQEPASPEVVWTANGGGYVRSGELTCPLSASERPLTVTCGGVEYVPSMTVVEPSGVEARDVSAVVYNVPVDHAGGIGMEMHFYVLPLDVSFSQIAIEEVPNDGGSTVGYFTHSDFREWWHHNEKTGAGNWLDVSVQNKIGVDYPRIEGELYRMMDNGLLVDDPSYGWRYGELNWEDPFGWNERGTANGEAEYKRFAVDEEQNMVILETGRTGVRKLKNAVTRDIDGTVYLNGKKVR